LRWRDASRVQHTHGFLDQGCETAPVITLQQLRLERQARQRVDRVVQVDQQLAPLHCTHVRVQLQRHFGALEQRQPWAQSGIVLRHQRTASATMERRRTQLRNVVRHHARQDLERRCRRRRGLGIGHAVLQRQHQSSGR
jgi:hypothetical protein